MELICHFDRLHLFSKIFPLLSVSHKIQVPKTEHKKMYHVLYSKKTQKQNTKNAKKLTQDTPEILKTNIHDTAKEITSKNLSGVEKRNH